MISVTRSLSLMDLKIGGQKAVRSFGSEEETVASERQIHLFFLVGPEVQTKSGVRLKINKTRLDLLTSTR